MATDYTDIPPEERDLLRRLREDPVVFIGSNAGLKELAAFIEGYHCAGGRILMEAYDHLGWTPKNVVGIMPMDFHKFIVKKVSGEDWYGQIWSETVLAYEPDNRKAYDLFWEILNEYLAQHGHDPLPDPKPMSPSRSVPDGLSLITPYDLPLLAESYMRTFNGEPWWDKWTRTTALTRLTDFYNTPGFNGVMYGQNGTTVGAIFGRSEQYFDKKAFQIVELWVEPAAQRQGIGQKLLAELRDMLPEHRFYLITMHGDATEGFYEKNGFVVQDGLCVMQQP